MPLGPDSDSTCSSSYAAMGVGGGAAVGHSLRKESGRHSRNHRCQLQLLGGGLALPGGPRCSPAEDKQFHRTPASDRATL